MSPNRKDALNESYEKEDFSLSDKHTGTPYSRLNAEPEVTPNLWFFKKLT